MNETPESNPAETAPETAPATVEAPAALGLPGTPEPAPEPAPEQAPAPEPAPEPAPAETAPTVPVAPVEVKPGHCHICGNGPFERVDLHIRFKHKGYKVGAKTGAAPPKPAKPGAQAPDPSNGVAPADFSDLVDPGPVADTNRLAPMLDRSKHYQAGAVLTFEMSTNILSQIFGDEWQPQSEQEKAFVVSALQKYYESIEMPDLPPGYVLCFVCLAYAAPRLAAPKTKNKLALAWYWVKSKFSRRKYPAAAQAKQPAPAIPAQQP